MTIRMEEFWRLATESGLVPTVATAQIEQAFRSHQPGQEVTPEAIAAFLVTHGRLTAFQADSLLASPPRPIRLGSWVIRSPETAPPFSKWIEASRSSDSSIGYLIRTVAGNPVLQAHAAISHAALQPIEFESLGDAWLVYSPIVGGKPFDPGNQPMAAEQVGRWGIALADAVATLHNAGLIHGDIAIDRLWMPPWDSPSPILLRDVSGAGDQANQWIDSRPDSNASVTSPARAPEWEPGGPPTVATDLYALAGMLYRLAEGEQAGRTLSEAKLPDKVQAAVEQGATGNPLYRVIGYAMAADPAQRLTDASTMAKALRAAVDAMSAAVEPSATQAAEVQPVTPKPAADESLVDEPIIDDSATSDPETVKPVEPVVVVQPEPPAAESGLPATPEVPAETKERVATKEPAATKERVAPTVPAAPKVSAASEVPAAPKVPAAPRVPAAPIAADEHETSVDSGPEPSPTHESKPHRTVVRNRRKRSWAAPMILIAMGMIVVGQLIYLAVVDPGPRVVIRDRPRPPLPSEVPPVRSAAKRAEMADELTAPRLANAEGSSDRRGAYQIVDDDRLLFAPPEPAGDDVADGPPLVALMPPGASVLAVLRPETWFGQSGDDDVVAALRQEWSPWVDSFERRSGLSVSEVEQLAVGFYPGRSGFPEVSYAVRTATPQSLEELSGRWEAESMPSTGQTASRRFRSGDTVYVALVGDDPDRSSSFFLGTLGQADLLPSDEELAAGPEQEPGLPITMRRLWRQLRADVDFAVVLQPNFMFADGRALLETSVPAFESHLRRVLIPDVSAISLSVHATEANYFWECRMVPAGRTSEAELLRTIEGEWTQWPDRADALVTQLALDDSWAPLARRFPAMVNFAVRQTRFGISQSAVTVNQYLPRRAAAQIGLAGLLAANAPRMAVGTAAPVEMDLAQIMTQPISLSFNRESLKAAMAVVQDEIKRALPPGVVAPQIELMGGDLQKNGITQNQQIPNFDQQQQPLRDVLTLLVLRANPDKTATSSHDPKQMLVWVLDESVDPPLIRITTRDASVGNYELPTEFSLEPATP